VDRRRLDPLGVIRIEVDRYVVGHLTVVGYLGKQSMEVNEFLLFHGQFAIATGRL
jgi:hypothetical protein